MHISSALVSSIRDGSLFGTFWQNLFAGLTVGIVTLPLSMGLADANGEPLAFSFEFLSAMFQAAFAIAILGLWSLWLSAR